MVCTELHPDPRTASFSGKANDDHGKEVPAVVEIEDSGSEPSQEEIGIEFEYSCSAVSSSASSAALSIQNDLGAFDFVLPS